MKKNYHAVMALFSVLMFCVVLSWATTGSHYWNDGEIVRGTKINVALDEKANTSANSFFVLTAQTDFATSTAAAGTVYRNAFGTLNYLSTGTVWLTFTATTTDLVF